MSKINKIKLSGTTYDVEDANASKTVELTQAQYDALSTKDPNTFYIITDAQAVDLTNYYTKSETNTLLNGKQATLVSGTNIKTINNESLLGSGNIDIQGGGGGKVVSGGTNISVTTGETADTINCTLPISGDSKGIYNTLSYPFVGSGTKGRNVVFGNNNTINRNGSSTSSYCNLMFGEGNSLGNGEYTGNLTNNLVGGRINKVYGSVSDAIVLGYSNELRNIREFASGFFNVSNTGSTDADKTLFSVGNGTSTSTRHNAFEIRQNGDIYLSLNGQDVKLQDQLGGSSITVDTALNSGSTNPVENRVIYNKIDEVEQVTSAALNNINDRLNEDEEVLNALNDRLSEDEEVTAAGLNAVNDKFDGLKLKKLTQAEYNALATKDASTLYIIVN